MSQPKSPKPKMATIREIYDRVLWDSRLDHSAFSLGFSDRISGNMREKRLSEWVFVEQFNTANDCSSILQIELCDRASLKGDLQSLW